MSLTVIKLPVIPAVKGDSDIKSALDNLRSFFKDLNDKGGIVSAQDLMNAGLVKNVNGQLVKK